MTEPLKGSKPTSKNISPMEGKKERGLIRDLRTLLYQGSLLKVLQYRKEPNQESQNQKVDSMVFISYYLWGCFKLVPLPDIKAKLFSYYLNE